LTPDQQLAAFDDGRIDIGFTRKLPPDHRADFEEENIYTDELGIALSTSHPLALAANRSYSVPSQGARTLFDEVIAVCRGAGF
jgi:DNA-binding transcriptional LysR family regulator